MKLLRLIRGFGLAVGCWLCGIMATGCWDRTEVNDLALITGAAIDRLEDGTIELSAQIFVPRAAGSGGLSLGQGGGIGGSNTLVHSARGVNVADAFSHLQESMPRYLFWGHAEIFIFGEAAARHGIRSEVDYLMRAPQPRERAFVYVTRGKGRSILEQKALLERDTSEVLREIAKSKTTLGMTLADLAEMLSGDSDAVALPFMETILPQTENNPDKSIFLISGTAVFKSDRMVGILDEKTTRGVLWLLNEIRNAVITVTPKGEKGMVSLRLIESHTKLKAHIQDGKWRITVHIRTEDDAIQNTTKADLTGDPSAVKEVERAMELDVRERVEMALEEAQKRLKADIFDFAGVFHRAYPKEWHRMKDRWDVMFPQVETVIEPHAILLRPGLSNIKAITSQERKEE